MSEGFWLFGIWALVQIVRMVPGIIWSVRCPPASSRYVYPVPAAPRPLPTLRLPKRTG